MTAGIRFSFTLLPYLLEDQEGDKVVLPEGCLQDLHQQDAFGKGAMTFRLTYNDHTTHCGVKEFSSEDGTIGLPKKVWNSLSLPSPSSPSLNAAVSIKYVQLSKATFVQLEPKHNVFFEIIPVKLMLEENLQLHTALTVGDTLTVWYR